MPTTYTVQTLVADEATDVTTKGAKPAAIKAAEAARTETGLAVQVVTQSGKVVFAKGALKDRAKPYTRTDAELPLGEGVALPKNFEVAYKRTRIKALVLRGTKDKKSYLVFNAETGASLEASGTKEACSITTGLRKGSVAWPAA